MLLAACSGSFSATESGGEDASDENPAIQPGAADGSTDGSAGGDAGHHDATAPDATEEGHAGDASGDVSANDVVDAGGPEAESGSPGCPTGDIECSGTCVPSDVNNCGTCGNSCTNLPHVSGATSCTAGGQCSFPPSACATGWADCDGNPSNGCETDITQPATCGSCSNACGASAPVCSGGSCVTGCSGSESLCSGTCVDTTSNPGDCDGCGKACTDSVANSQATCVNSACSFTCNSSFTGCPTAAPTACVNEQTDPGNCGGCNTKCPGPTSGTGTAACSGGKCTLDCAAGLTACPAAPSEPTECANTTNDTSNCGSCGHVCTTSVSNATPSCASSTCGFTCNSGYQLCNGNTCIPDADTTNGAFVSPSGSGTACTASQPCTTIAAAVATGKTTIYLDKGTYSELVVLPAAGLTIHGGWTDSGGTWTDCNPTNATSIISAPAGDTAAVSNTGNGLWTLDTLTIEDENAAGPSQSLYGAFLTGGNLTVENVEITVAGGGNGAGVGTGSSGTAPPASCTQGSSTVGATGANGATYPAGANGQQGVYSATGFTSGNGSPGTMGGQGVNGGPGNPSTACSDESCYFAPNAAGCGGADCCASSTGSTLCAANTGCVSQYCGATGGIGCGGGGGGPGPAGNGGGASIGIFAANTTVSVTTGVTINVGPGGAGSAGGGGGQGAGGSTGPTDNSVVAPTACSSKKSGSDYTCVASTTTPLAGGAGSTGGNGGNGSAGGGGAGGDALCYATFGATAVTGTPVCNAPQASAGGGTAPSGRTGLHN